ncbi:CPBP family intramembrane glutamic endopeptidase [Halomicroarcula sp. GCM10025324]|uniref:CPBP family intramembrane glutamic endopeptidase n=1 Tax=Haloarcula TaxID=2237 RepID=UPI0023E84B08|nr:CPBP family intramembrane glutamic endopeptidase [Halomicroarcula sp. ZS-22-S1]
MPSRIRRRISDRPVTTFFVVAYLVSWSAWAPLVFSDWWATWSPLVLADDMQTMVFIMVGGFGPLVAAGLVTWVIGDSVREWAGQLFRWNVSIRYWVFALLFPAVAVITASAAHIAVFGGQFDPESTGVLVLYPVLFLQVFLVGGGNEELGWRGFALPRLQESYSALASSLLIGVGWFAWHLPLFLVGGSSQAGVPVYYYGVAVIALSVVFTWLYNETGGSVLLTMVLHASVNTGGILYLAGGGAALQTNLPNALYAVVFLAAALVLVATYGPERLADAEIPTRLSGSQ